MSRKCGCKGWERNIAKVEAPRLLLAARNPGTANYDGAPWRFCPWCGNELFDAGRGGAPR